MMNRLIELEDALLQTKRRNSKQYYVGALGSSFLTSKNNEPENKFKQDDI